MHRCLLGLSIALIGAQAQLTFLDSEVTLFDNRRFKRQANDEHYGIICASRECFAGELIERFGYNGTLDFLGGLFKLTFNHPWARDNITLGTLFEPTNFSVFCGAYATAETCLYNCPSSFIGQLLRTGLKGLRYMCIDHREEAASHLVCYQTQLDEAQVECKRTCPNRQRYKNDYVAQCIRGGCLQRCLVKTLNRDCPQDPRAGEFYREMTSFMVRKMLDLLKHVDARAPDECLELA